MDLILSLFIGALMAGHTSGQIQEQKEHLIIVQTEVKELEYALNGMAIEQDETLAKMSQRIEDNHIQLGSMAASDGARIALIEQQMEDFGIRQASLRQQMINLREYVTAD